MPERRAGREWPVAEAEFQPLRLASLDPGRLSLKWSVGQLARLYLLSTDDFVADTACFGALQREKGKRRATVRTVVGPCRCPKLHFARIWCLAKNSAAPSARFEGFPPDATRFFAGLAANNNRDWFQVHRETYEQAVREPLKAFVAEFAPRFGPARISRINRDNRFFKDRPPYKTHIDAGVGAFYLSLSSHGFYVGTGFYMPDSSVLERFRGAIDRDGSGKELMTIIAGLRRKGYRVDTHERLTSAPRGYAKDHPRLELLQMKDIHAGLLMPPDAITSRKLLDRVTRTMTDLKPFAGWLKRHVG
jgi:uncharacterized protein (TIGR02453 family)